MSTTFDEIVTLLRNVDQEIPPDRVTGLSDLDPDQLSRFSALWESLPVERRRSLIQILGEEAYAHVELNFEHACRLALGDPDPVVRQMAIDNLWECEDPALVNPFLRALTSDVSASVRRSAAAALGQYVLLGEVEQIRPELLLEIEEGLIAAGGVGGTPEVRRAALESLGYSSRDELPEMIRRAYDSSDEPFIRSALVAMGRSANPVWQPEVQAQIISSAPALRLAAVQAAGELELTETVPDLVELLDDVSDEVRRAAIWSLGQLGGDVARQVLGDLLESSEDTAETQIVQDALDNLAFVDGTRDLLMFDLDASDTD